MVMGNVHQGDHTRGHVGNKVHALVYTKKL